MAPVTTLPAAWAGPLLLLTWLAPLLALAALAVPGWRERAHVGAPWAALPGLVSALFLAEGATLELPWVLTGLTLAMEPVGRVFLLLAALLWGTAAGFARGYLARDPARHRFLGFYLAAMAGNLGLTVAQDPAGFLAFFALMGLPAYGLVVHNGTPFARRAANVYLGATVTGETLALAGLLLGLGTGQTEAGTFWLVAGLGVKAGLLPLHFWLPLAHPAAPAPASAVLSGSMIKAGLLGWLRFLPLGEAALPQLGGALFLLGLAGAFLAVVVGLAQREAKTVLAYSSVSQMGWMAAAVGAGLAAPSAWPALLAAVLAYALHHGLAKGALFLSTAVVPAGPSSPGRRLALGAGLVLPALAIAGLPATSGAAAKVGLKEALSTLPGLAEADPASLLALGAAATTLLMVRFLFVLAPGHGVPGAARGWWAALVGLVVLLPWVWAPLRYWGLKALSPDLLGPTLLPVAAAALLALAWWLALRRLALSVPPPLPAGDWYVAAEAAVRRLAHPTAPAWRLLGRLWRPRNRIWDFVHYRLWLPGRSRLTAADRWAWTTSGTAFLLILVLLAVLLSQTLALGLD
jgi:formate hydrogenlyase subunit 3/multisubunit Na+/H+ antiporter MnhD subunit